MFYLAGIIIVSLVISFAAACPATCTCKWYGNILQAVCYGGYIPTDLPYETTHVLFQYNNLTELNVNVCDILPNLQEFALGINSVVQIPDGYFKRCDQLIGVYMHNNRIQSIEGYTFVNMTKLTYLWLQYNEISVIKQNAFVNLTGLKRLYLHGNRLQSIEENTFVNMVNLNILNLETNMISVIKQNSFVNLGELQTLDLTANPLSCDCSIVPFWIWLTQRPALGTSAKCSNGKDVISILTNDLTKCNVMPLTVNVFNQAYLAIIGGNVTLGCTVTGYPVASNIWWTDSKGIRLNGSRYSGGNPSSPSLTIKDVIESDTGQYTCHATNTEGTLSQSTQLETGCTPYAEVARKYYALKTSENVTLECKVNKSDTVHWYKDGIVIRGGTKYNFSGIQNQDLIIIDVTPTDRGRYMCRATNKFGDYSDAILLKIVQTDIPHSSYEKTVNESVTLQCLIYDATEVKWRHNYVYIPTESGRYSGGNVTVPSLTVTRLARVDSGMYQCESLFESVISTSSGIELKIRDKPLVNTFEENIQATVAEDVIIECSFDSYPEPTDVSWMKDDNILIVRDNAKYNGSTVKIPSLTIYNVNNADSGIYVCYVENSIGRSSGKYAKLFVQVSEPPKSSSTVGPVAGGISGGIVAVVIVVVILYIYTKRKWTNSRKNSNYETRDDAKVELHLYDATQMPNITDTKSPVYVNTSIGLASSQGDMNTTFKLYDAQDFMRILQEKLSLSKHIRKEYEMLNSGPMFRAASDYEIVDVKTDATIAEEYTCQALIKKHDDRSGYIITTVPDQIDIDNFWIMIINYHVGSIVLLLQEVEKISEFFPNTIVPINTRSFKVEICSFDKIQNNIFVLVLDISNKVKNTVMQVRLYKITDWKVGEIYPSIDTMCKLLDVISSKEPGMVALMGSKGIGFPVCGNFGMCHEVIHAIHNAKKFNIFQIVVGLKQIRPDLFQTFEQYNLCYKVIGHFLQNEHTYAVIGE